MLGVLGVGEMNLTLENQQLLESWTNVVSLGLWHYLEASHSSSGGFGKDPG